MEICRLGVLFHVNVKIDVSKPWRKQLEEWYDVKWEEVVDYEINKLE